MALIETRSRVRMASVRGTDLWHPSSRFAPRSACVRGGNADNCRRSSLLDAGAERGDDGGGNEGREHGAGTIVAEAGDLLDQRAGDV